MRTFQHAKFNDCWTTTPYIRWRWRRNKFHFIFMISENFNFNVGKQNMAKNGGRNKHKYIIFLWWCKMQFHTMEYVQLEIKHAASDIEISSIACRHNIRSRNYEMESNINNNENSWRIFLIGNFLFLSHSIQHQKQILTSFQMNIIYLFNSLFQQKS